MNYTYTPIYNRASKPAREDFGGPAQAAAGYGRSYSVSEELEDRREYMTQPGSKDTFMLALLFFVLPILGLLAILMKPMRWVFCAATLVSLVALLGFRSFLPKSRAVTSFILVALIGVSMFGAIAKPRLTTIGDAANTANLNNTTDLLNVTNTPQAGVLPQATAEPEDETQTTHLAQVTQAEIKLMEFMELWRQGASADDLIPYTWEEWRAANSTNMQVALFYLVNPNTSLLEDYTIEAPQIADLDTSATLRVTAEIGGANAATRRYDVIMHKDKNGAWFIDPSSFKTGVTVIGATPTPNPGVSATPKASATVNPNMKLYFNTDGGKLYHTKADCSTIGKEYLKKMSSFVYSKLQDTAYKKLQPCTECGAPPRP